MFVFTAAENVASGLNKYDLPVCIHVRDAEQDCLEILKMVKNPNKV